MESFASATPDFVKRHWFSVDYPVLLWLLAQRCDSAEVGILHYAPAWIALRVLLLISIGRVTFSVHKEVQLLRKVWRMIRDELSLKRYTTLAFSAANAIQEQVAHLDRSKVTSNVVCSHKGLGNRIGFAKWQVRSFAAPNAWGLQSDNNVRLLRSVLTVLIMCSTDYIEAHFAKCEGNAKRSTLSIRSPLCYGICFGSRCWYSVW